MQGEVIPLSVRFLSRVACASYLMVSIVVAEEYRVTPNTDMDSVVDQSTAGDSLVLESGKWNDAKLKFEQLAGTADAPILIRAQTAGKVVFSGATYHWVSYAIVDQNWKLVTNKDSSYLELFDIAADPYEKTDLKEAEPEVVERLLEKLAGWKATLPDKPTGNVFSAERSQ